MSLDLTKVGTQVGNMVANIKANRREKEGRLQHALETLKNPPLDLDRLSKKIASSKTTWLVAGLVDGLDRRHEHLPTPADFTVIATDGSHIDVDRHQSTRCYLINIGGVVLRYGNNADARLESSPSLYFGDEDLVIIPPTPKDREQPVEGALLGIKRAVDECRRLSELASEQPSDIPTLALLDGTLILWGLEAFPQFVAEALLDKAFLLYLDVMSSKHTALASYISSPRSTDVLNVLRVAICPHDVADCDRFCAEKREKDCDSLSGIRDRDLMSNLLDEGERSALFISPSKVVEKHYGPHQISFFYLRVDDEIARVEIPRWVALDEGLLNLTHTLVSDQCRRGHGYPVALSEAHEQAVVTGADRENFWQMVESSLVEEHMQAPTSAKNRSKRARWV